MSDDTADRPLPEQFWLSPGYDCDLDLCCQICDWKVTVGATTIASVLDDAKAHIAEKHTDTP